MTPQEISPSDIAVWQVPDSRYEIRYALPVFQDIDHFVNEGYRRIAHGGLETGGVLFGRILGEAIQIEAYLPIACEHSTGPSFVLSPKDVEGLRNQLAEDRSGTELDGLEILGWFIGHTRNELMVLDREAVLFDELFPRPWQVTLLVKPEKYKPTRFAAAVRNEHGLPRDIAATAIILPISTRGPERAPDEPLRSIPAPRYEPEKLVEALIPATAPPIESPVAKREELLEEAPVSEPEPLETRESPAPKVARIAIANRPSAIVPPPVPVQEQRPPVTVQEQGSPVVFIGRHRQRRRESARSETTIWPRALIALALFALLSAGVYWTYLNYLLPPVPLQVDLTNDMISVRWPLSATANAQRADLIIHASGVERTVSLSQDQRAAGQCVVASKAPEVSIYLRSQFRFHESFGSVIVVRKAETKRVPSPVNQ